MKKIVVRIYGILILLGCVLHITAQVKIEKQKEGLLFTENGENVLFYQVEQKHLEGKYERCNYIHPLWGMDGAVLTEDFPADHLHHRGIFWAWHQIWIEGKRIGDGWEIKDFEQEISNVDFSSEVNGTGVLKTEVFWKSELWKKNGVKTPYIKENTVISVHPETGNYRKIDFEISLLALCENLSIGGSEDVKGYSGFSVRMVLPGDVKFIGPAGEIEPKNEAVKSNGYVNVAGSVGKNGVAGGIVIADDPGNPSFPQSWILRSRNSMQNAAWPGNQTIPVSTVKPLVLKYSLVVYQGDISSEKINDIIK